MKPVLLFACLVQGLLSFACTSTSAGLIITFSNPTPSPFIAGMPGQLDVMVASNTMDQLNGFVAEFLLTPVTGTAGGLVFTSTQSDSQLADPNYIFFGGSQSFNNGLPVGVVPPVDMGTRYVGADFTDDGLGGSAPVLVPETPLEALLFRLDFSALTAGTYEIRMDEAKSDFFDQNDDLYPAGTVTSTPFTLTVASSSAAVPEPSSAVGLAVLAATSMIMYRRRQRSASKNSGISSD